MPGPAPAPAPAPAPGPGPVPGKAAQSPVVPPNSTVKRKDTNGSNGSGSSRDENGQPKKKTGLPNNQGILKSDIPPHKGQQGQSQGQGAAGQTKGQGQGQNQGQGAAGQTKGQGQGQSQGQGAAGQTKGQGQGQRQSNATSKKPAPAPARQVKSDSNLVKQSKNRANKPWFIDYGGEDGFVVEFRDPLDNSLPARTPARRQRPLMGVIEVIPVRQSPDVVQIVEVVPIVRPPVQQYVEVVEVSRGYPVYNSWSDPYNYAGGNYYY